MLTLFLYGGIMFDYFSKVTYKVLHDLALTIILLTCHNTYHALHFKYTLVFSIVFDVWDVYTPRPNIAPFT